MPTIPPTITPVPTPAPQRGDRTTFSNRVDAFVSWLTTAVGQFIAVVANVYANAVDAYNSATDAMGAATTAVSAVGNLRWVSGTTYTDGAVVWSPLDRRTYRRIGAGGGTTDPSADFTNWLLLSQEPGLHLIGAATITTPVASINFLNIFTDDCQTVEVEMYGITCNPSAAVYMRAAVGGTALSAASDYSTITGGAGTNIGTVNGTQDFINISQQSVNSSVTRGYSGVLTLRNCRSTKPKQVKWSAMTPNTTVDLFVQEAMGAIFNTGLLSGFQIYPAGGGSFSAGTVLVYARRTK